MNQVMEKMMMSKTVMRKNSNKNNNKCHSSSNNSNKNNKDRPRITGSKSINRISSRIRTVMMKRMEMRVIRKKETQIAMKKRKSKITKM